MRVYQKILILLFLCACSTKESKPISVSIGYTQPQHYNPISFSIGDFDYQINEIYVVLSAIELHLCETPPVVQYSLIPSAYAHVASSATRLGVPYLIALHQEQIGARIIGEIAPPPADYCGGYIIISPADEDIMNLTDLDSEEIVGHSMVIKGRFRKVGTREWAPLIINTDTKSPFSFSLKSNSFSLKAGKHKQLLLSLNWPSLISADPNDPLFSEILLKQITNNIQTSHF